MVNIYKLSNSCNDKVYIGSTIKALSVRLGKHLNFLKNNNHHNKEIQIDYYFFGESSFNLKITLLEKVEESVRFTKEEYYIHNYTNLYNKDLYPTTSGLVGIYGSMHGMEIMDPEDIIHIIEPSISKFCLEHALDKGAISNVIRGTTLHHKGWKLPDTDRRDCKIYGKSSGTKFISPDGIIHTVTTTMNAFAYKHNLISSHMTAIKNGRRKSHKGWKLYEV